MDTSSARSFFLPPPPSGSSGVDHGVSSPSTVTPSTHLYNSTCTTTGNAPPQASPSAQVLNPSSSSTPNVAPPGGPPAFAAPPTQGAPPPLPPPMQPAAGTSGGFAPPPPPPVNMGAQSFQWAPPTAHQGGNQAAPPSHHMHQHQSPQQVPPQHAHQAGAHAQSQGHPQGQPPQQLHPCPPPQPQHLHSSPGAAIGGGLPHPSQPPHVFHHQHGRVPPPPVSLPPQSKFQLVPPAHPNQPPPPNVGVRSEALLSLTSSLVDTYQKCNADFKYQPKSAPKRVLTKLSEGVYNNGNDNSKHDYICRVRDSIPSPDRGYVYSIVERLGHGTFGQVLKCQVLDQGGGAYAGEALDGLLGGRGGGRGGGGSSSSTSSENQLENAAASRELEGLSALSELMMPGGECGRDKYVALKIIKNKPAYFHQALVEVRILRMLNERFNEEDRIVKMLDFFVYRKHLCIAFEILSVNLYDVLKQNGFRGLSTLLIRNLIEQIVRALQCLRKARIIHCDLKPENVLLSTTRTTQVKLIDFGSACFEGHIVYTYIQSRFYRSPEVLFGLPYSSAIDIWSLGCICAELYIGLPIFPGCSEYDQVRRITDVCGVPPAHMMEGSHSAKYFVPIEDESDNSDECSELDEYEEPNDNAALDRQLGGIVEENVAAITDAAAADVAAASVAVASGNAGAATASADGATSFFFAGAGAAAASPTSSSSTAAASSSASGLKPAAEVQPIFQKLKKAKGTNLRDINTNDLPRYDPPPRTASRNSKPASASSSTTASSSAKGTPLSATFGDHRPSSGMFTQHLASGASPINLQKALPGRPLSRTTNPKHGIVHGAVVPPSPGSVTGTGGAPPSNAAGAPAVQHLSSSKSGTVAASASGAATALLNAAAGTGGGGRQQDAQNRDSDEDDARTEYTLNFDTDSVSFLPSRVPTHDALVPDSEMIVDNIVDHSVSQHVSESLSPGANGENAEAVLALSTSRTGGVQGDAGTTAGVGTRTNSQIASLSSTASSGEGSSQNTGIATPGGASGALKRNGVAAAPAAGAAPTHSCGTTPVATAPGKFSTSTSSSGGGGGPTPTAAAQLGIASDVATSGPGRGGQKPPSCSSAEQSSQQESIANADCAAVAIRSAFTGVLEAVLENKPLRSADAGTSRLPRWSPLSGNQPVKAKKVDEVVIPAKPKASQSHEQIGLRLPLGGAGKQRAPHAFEPRKRTHQREQIQTQKQKFLASLEQNAHHGRKPTRVRSAPPRMFPDANSRRDYGKSALYPQKQYGSTGRHHQRRGANRGIDHQQNFLGARGGALRGAHDLQPRGGKANKGSASTSSRNTKASRTSTQQGGSASWRMKTKEEFERQTGKKEGPSKKYFDFGSLEEMVKSVRMGQKTDEETRRREELLGFLQALLQLDPAKRASPDEAIRLPFVNVGARRSGATATAPTARVAGAAEDVETKRPAETGAEAPNGTPGTTKPSALQQPTPVHQQAAGTSAAGGDPEEPPLVEAGGPMILTEENLRCLDLPADHPESYRPPVDSLPDSYFYGFLHGRYREISHNRGRHPSTSDFCSTGTPVGAATGDKTNTAACGAGSNFYAGGSTSTASGGNNTCSTASGTGKPTASGSSAFYGGAASGPSSVSGQKFAVGTASATSSCSSTSSASSASGHEKVPVPAVGTTAAAGAAPPAAIAASTTQHGSPASAGVVAFTAPGTAGASISSSVGSGAFPGSEAGTRAAPMLGTAVNAASTTVPPAGAAFVSAASNPLPTTPNANQASARNTPVMAPSSSQYQHQTPQHSSTSGTVPSAPTSHPPVNNALSTSKGVDLACGRYGSRNKNFSGTPSSDATTTTGPPGAENTPSQLNMSVTINGTPSMAPGAMPPSAALSASGSGAAIGPTGATLYFPTNHANSNYTSRSPSGSVAVLGQPSPGGVAASQYGGQQVPSCGPGGTSSELHSTAAGSVSAQHRTSSNVTTSYSNASRGTAPSGGPAHNYITGTPQPQPAGTPTYQSASGAVRGGGPNAPNPGLKLVQYRAKGSGYHHQKPRKPKRQAYARPHSWASGMHPRTPGDRAQPSAVGYNQQMAASRGSSPWHLPSPMSPACSVVSEAERGTARHVFSPADSWTSDDNTSVDQQSYYNYSRNSSGQHYGGGHGMFGSGGGTSAGGGSSAGGYHGAGGYATYGGGSAPGGGPFNYNYGQGGAGQVFGGGSGPGYYNPSSPPSSVDNGSRNANSYASSGWDSLPPGQSGGVWDLLPPDFVGATPGMTASGSAAAAPISGGVNPVAAAPASGGPLPLDSEMKRFHPLAAPKQISGCQSFRAKTGMSDSGPVMANKYK